jgi:tetratricopeptide (TPR) repeat protein
LHLSKGELLYQLEHYDAALFSFDRAILINPQLKSAYHGKARTFDFEALERFKEAKQIRLSIEELFND